MAVRSQGAAPVAAVTPVTPPAGTPKSVRVVTVPVTPGLVALAGKKLTASVPGVKVADVVFPSVPAGLALGVGIGNARVSAADTVELSITCTLALGVTLGAVSVSLLICEM
jgi:hypothetical protein